MDPNRKEFLKNLLSNFAFSLSQGLSASSRAPVGDAGPAGFGAALQAPMVLDQMRQEQAEREMMSRQRQQQMEMQKQAAELNKQQLARQYAESEAAMSPQMTGMPPAGQEGPPELSRTIPVPGVPALGVPGTERIVPTQEGALALSQQEQQREFEKMKQLKQYEASLGPPSAAPGAAIRQVDPDTGEITYREIVPEKPTVSRIDIKDPEGGSDAVPAVQKMWSDGRSEVYYKGKLVENPKKFRAPSISLLTRDEMVPRIQRIAAQLAGHMENGKYVHGDLTPITDIASMRTNERFILYDEIKKLDPNYDTARLKRMVKIEEYWTVGKGADQLQSFGTFYEHAGAAKQALDNIELSDVPAANKPLNWWRKNMSGDPLYTDLMAALEPVRKEFESFLLGGRALYAEDRKAAEAILSEDSSPAQISIALQRLAHTATARMRESNFRYRREMKKDMEDPVSVEAIEGAALIGIDLLREISGGKHKPETESKMIRMVGPDGKEYLVPRENLETAKSMGMTEPGVK